MKRLRRGGVVTAVGIATLGATAAVAQSSNPYYGPHMWDGGGWWMFLGPLTMIVFVVAIVVLAVLLVQWMVTGQRDTGRPGRGDTALDILKARFARGEIDKDEFEERRRVLGA